ncbi:p25 [Carrot yellow leaf virus]|uniref:p25 n=1 Tax=Carrot yellow leaf virus TaxID=656190 RepID=C6GFK6_9CLOS|nr:p25 [Carrot yellow leaf virus]ACT10251.1 p25 [Carrot yellow leaf virus]
MKLYISIYEYIALVSEISRLLDLVSECVSGVTYDKFKEFRYRFVHLTMLIPSLKSDLNDSLRDEGFSMQSEKKEQLVLFEKTCSDVQSKLRRMIVQSYSISSPLDLVVFFCKKHYEMRCCDYSTIMHDKVKPSCDAVLRDISNTFGVDVSPRSFENGGFLTLKDTSFRHLFKDCFGVGEEEIRRLLNERETGSSLFSVEPYVPKYVSEGAESHI